ncbi:hypothetical protein C0Q70_14633 [Pomacea canaliculata]|uniref:RING-type domain-containing protein n=1 Tax=Pomacea canaliculata TaxID=400727 RepID=A0A2T7NSN8_POMCA|nr:hypothetical protein C0Q70_14633 [Pomacea canaliculata]
MYGGSICVTPVKKAGLFCSTNGTLFNSSIKLSKGKRQQIDHGDEFYIIYKKGEEELNVGYVYQDLQRLREEEKEEEVDTTLEYDSEALPLIDATIADESLNQVMDEELKALHGVKRKHPAELNLELVTKEARFQVESNPVTTQEGCQGLEAAKRNSLTKQTSCQPSEAAESDPLSTTVIITTTTTATTTTPCSTSFSTNITERAAAVDIAEGKQISINSPPQDLVPSISAKTPQNVEEEDSFASTLTCIICQELLHDCISLQPCMHSFCAGCYSEWMSQSKECPSCRTRVERINKNHIVNNLIDAYLKEHPDKQRSEEDIKTLNAKNKITHDMLYPRQRSSSSDYSESDNEDQDQLLAPWIAPVTGSVFGFGTPYFGVTNLAYRARCRQCPGASNNSTASINSPVAGVAGGSCASATSNTEQPSVSGVTTTGDASYALHVHNRRTEVTARPNCYWGKQCRTQRNKPAHAHDSVMSHDEAQFTGVTGPQHILHHNPAPTGGVVHGLACSLRHPRVRLITTFVGNVV